jgi:hypothetical protein
MDINSIILREMERSIETLSPETKEAVNELAEQIRQQIKIVGDQVGMFAIALIRAEMKSKNNGKYV